MNIRTSHRTVTALASSIVFGLCACNAQVATMGDVEPFNGTATEGSDELPGDGCNCATSDSLRALSCSGGEVPLLDNDVVQTTADGNVVAFNLNDAFGNSSVVYWSSSSGARSLPSTGMLIGLNALGDRVLVTGGTEDGLQLIDVNGESVSFPLQMIIGRGFLNASGDTIVGQIHDESGSQLAKATVSTGEVELLGKFGPISRAYVTPDASVIVGSNSTHAIAFRWTAQDVTFDLTGELEHIFLLPEAVSADGSVIAGQDEGAHFRWTAAEGYTELASASGWSETFMSADGSVVLGSWIQPATVAPPHSGGRRARAASRSRLDARASLST